MAAEGAEGLLRELRGLAEQKHREREGEDWGWADEAEMTEGC